MVVECAVLVESWMCLVPLCSLGASLVWVLDCCISCRRRLWVVLKTACPQSGRFELPYGVARVPSVNGEYLSLACMHCFCKWVYMEQRSFEIPCKKINVTFSVLESACFSASFRCTYLSSLAVTENMSLLQASLRWVTRYSIFYFNALNDVLQPP